LAECGFEPVVVLGHGVTTFGSLSSRTWLALIASADRETVLIALSLEPGAN
jgi:hypothetical protein